MEIERKFLIKALPEALDRYVSHRIEQAYLCTNPVVRVRRQDDEFFLTYKGSGMLMREEYNLPLTQEGYEHLLQKADGTVIAKRRIVIPLETDGLNAELDLFEGSLRGLKIVEVEFPDQRTAESFVPPAWFGKDVTFIPDFHNSAMSRMSPEKVRMFLDHYVR